MTIKTDYSRFDIHDVLTAPEGSVNDPQGHRDRGAEITKFIGVLAGAPAALRAFARMRHELREGVLPRATRERIALAVAERRGDTYSVAQHARTGRAARARARRGLAGPVASPRATRRRPRCSSSSSRCSPPTSVPVPTSARRRREAGWTDEEILEAVAHVALAEFQTLIANAAALPQDQIDPASCPPRPSTGLGDRALHLAALGDVDVGVGASVAGVGRCPGRRPVGRLPATRTARRRRRLPNSLSGLPPFTLPELLWPSPRISSSPSSPRRTSAPLPKTSPSLDQPSPVMDVLPAAAEDSVGGAVGDVTVHAYARRRRSGQPRRRPGSRRHRLPPRLRRSPSRR